MDDTDLVWMKYSIEVAKIPKVYVLELLLYEIINWLIVQLIQKIVLHLG